MPDVMTPDQMDAAAQGANIEHGYVDSAGNVQSTWDQAAQNSWDAGNQYYGGIQDPNKTASQDFRTPGRRKITGFDAQGNPIYGEEDSHYLPSMDDLRRSGLLPPRLLAAMTPLNPGQPYAQSPYALLPQGDYRPVSQQTLQHLHPSDLQALQGTLGQMGNRPEDFLPPGYSGAGGGGPQVDRSVVRQGPQVRIA